MLHLTFHFNHFSHPDIFKVPITVKTAYDGKMEKAATFAATLTLFLLVCYSQITPDS